VAVAVALDIDVLARVGTALADDSRRRLLVALLDGPRYPTDLAEEFALTRANVSNHLACLRGCGLVVTVPKGRNVRYQLADARLARALKNLAQIVLEIDPAVCEAAARGEDCC